MGDWHFIVGRLVQKRCTAKKMHYFFFTYRNFIQQTSHDALLPKCEFTESGRVAVQVKEKPSANPEQPKQCSFRRCAALQSFQVRAASFMTKTHHSLTSVIQKLLMLQYTMQLISGLHRALLQSIIFISQLNALNYTKLRS